MSVTITTTLPSTVTGGVVAGAYGAIVTTVLTGPPGPGGPAGSAGNGNTLIDPRSLVAIAAVEGGGAQLNRWVYPSAGYGGATATVNPQSPTLIDLVSLGVSKVLWFQGVAGTSGTDYSNVVSTTGTITGNDGSGNPLPLILDVDMITNELDPVAGQSTYYVVAKPSCFALYFDETLTPNLKVWDGTGNIVFTATAALPTKRRVRLQAVLLPGGITGTQAAQVTFLTSNDGGATWSQLGDLATSTVTRQLNGYATTSGSALGTLVGGNSYGNVFRGAIIKAIIWAGGTINTDGTVTGATALATMDPGAQTGTPTSWTGPQGNTWTIQRLQASNWVTQSCLASAGTGNGGSGNDEYLTVNGTQMLTTAGLYPSVTTTGVLVDFTDRMVATDYAQNNNLINLLGTPTLLSAQLTLDSNGYLVVVGPSGTITQIASP